LLEQPDRHVFPDPGDTPRGSPAIENVAKPR
jgi:hypothetical protein